jgi:hypothetical protein
MAKHHDRGYGHKGVPLRQPAAYSYSASDGRAASSLAPDGKSHEGYSRAENVNPQIPDGFDRINQRRTQSPEPVHRRPFTKVHEG